MFVLPAIEGQGDGGGAVRVYLGLQFPARILEAGKRPEGRGPGGGVQHLHQGGHDFTIKHRFRDRTDRRRGQKRHEQR